MSQTNTKVCMLLDNPFVDDKRVYKEAKSLVDNEYDVTILCQMDFDGELPTEENVDGIKVKRVFRTNLGTSTLIDKYLRAHFELIDCINESYDIYHCHDPETWPMGYILAGKAGAKLICDSHEYFPDYICREWHADAFKYELTKYLVKARGEYIRYADKVIVVSEQTSKVLKEEFGLQEEPTVLYNTRPCIDIPKGENLLRKRYSIKNSLSVLLFQGLVEPSRGVDLIIEALPHIKDSVLVVAGKDRGDHIKELQQLAEKHGVDERVIFTGFMSPDDLLLYSTFADILVYFGRPSVLNMEYSIPNKFFDYIMAEKPMVVSDLLSLKSLVEKYGLGEIVSIHNADVQEIASKVSSLLRDKIRQKQIVENMKKVKHLFSWEKQEEKLLKIYSELCDKDN